MAGTQ